MKVNFKFCSVQLWWCAKVNPMNFIYVVLSVSPSKEMGDNTRQRENFDLSGN